MQYRADIYVPLIYLLGAIPYIWLGLHAWSKRPAVAVTPFAWAMLGMSIWTFTYGLEVFLPTLPLKILTMKVEYLGIVSIPVFLLFFAFEFTGNNHLLVSKFRLLLWVIPIIFLALVWTNEFHSMMWDSAKLVDVMGLTLLTVRHGMFYWIQLTFSYLLVIFAGILLVTDMFQRPGTYHVQISLVVLSILTPWIGSLFLEANATSPLGIDIMPLLFLPTGLGLSWAVVRLRLLETLPLEHLSVLKNMKDGVIALSANHRILYVNPIAEKILGRAEKDVIGQPLARISTFYWEKIKPHLAVDHESRTEIEVEEENQKQVYEATISPIAAQNNNSTTEQDSIITLHDITERKEMENALARREAIMAAVSLSSEQFLRESVWEHNVPMVLEKIGQAVDVSRVYVVVNYKDEKNILYSSLCYEWAAPGITPQISNPRLRHIPLKDSGFYRWGKQLAEGLSIQGFVDDLPESEQRILKEIDSQSLAVAPIFVEKDWWGFVMFDDCLTKRIWTSMELKTLRTIASIIGSAESRTRAEQKLIRRQKALSLLQEIVGEALQAETLRAMTNDLAGKLADLISADECFITMWDDVTKQTTPLTEYGSRRDTYLSLQPVFGEYTLTELALHYGAILVVDDVFSSPYLEHEIAKQCPVHSMLVLPLIGTWDKKLGAIILAFTHPHKFQPEEVSICKQASSLLALAFEKFKAMEQAQQKAITSETLRKAGVAVAGALEMEVTVSHILEQLSHVIPYDSATIQLLRENELEIIGGRGWQNMQDVIGIHFPVPGDNPNSTVIQTKKPYLLGDVRTQHKEFSKPPHDHIRSWLGVPLLVREKVIGLLSIDSAEEAHFTHEDVELAVTFANQVSIALENARIFKQTQDQAIIDPLTSIYNRRGLLLMAEDKFEQALLNKLDFSCIMIDIDHFKSVNDTYGHDAGDSVLREVAAFCRRCVREIDFVARFGGEEIIIILPDAGSETSIMVAERVRSTIEKTPVKVSEDYVLPITASLGVACLDEYTTTLDMLIKRADQAMYMAKHRGRNQVAFGK